MAFKRLEFDGATLSHTRLPQATLTADGRQLTLNVAAVRTFKLAGFNRCHFHYDEETGRIGIEPFAGEVGGSAFRITVANTAHIHAVQLRRALDLASGKASRHLLEHDAATGLYVFNPLVSIEDAQSATADERRVRIAA